MTTLRDYIREGMMEVREKQSTLDNNSLLSDDDIEDILEAVMHKIEDTMRRLYE